MANKFAKGLTHRQFLKMCGLAIVGAGASQVVLPPAPAYADQTIQGNLDVTGPMISLGAGTAATASSTSTVGFIAIRGSTSNFNLNLQDGSGRVNVLWNATGGGGNYLVSSESASRLLISVNGSVGGTIGFYGAAAGTAGNPVSWTQTGYISSSDQVWFSTRGVSSDFFISSVGNVGIGTTTPDARLQVAGSVHLDGPLYFISPSDPNYKIELYYWPGSAAIRVKAWGAVSLATSYGDVLSVAGPYVGIGTTNPASALHINTGAIRIGTRIVADDYGSYYA